jgi:WD40 repeat protein
VTVVAQLTEALRGRGKDIWFDSDIPAASRWSDEIRNAITDSDSFIFIVTPDSVVSQECLKELEFAAGQSKRLVPIVIRETPIAEVPSSLAEWQLIFYRPEADFEQFVDGLIATIETDPEGDHEHTRLGKRAIEWKEKSSNRALLLRGSELTDSERWLASQAGKKPAPSANHTEYILTSRKAATRRQRGAVVVSLTLLVAMTALATVAYLQRNNARHQSRRAQARALAAEATADLSTNPEQSLALALNSTKLDASPTDVQALRMALADAPLRMAIQAGHTLPTHSDNPVLAAWDPTGNTIAITPQSGTVQLWDRRTGLLQQTLPGGTSPAVSLNYSPDGRWLSAVSVDGTVSAWNTHNNSAVSTTALNERVRSSKVSGATGPYTSVAWIPFSDGLVVFGSGVSQLLELDPTSGQLQSLADEPQGTETAVASPDGGGLFVIDSRFPAGAVIGLTAGGQRPLTLPSGLRDLSGHNGCWSVDNRYVVTWDPTEAQDLAMRVWNASTGAQVTTMQTGSTIKAATCSAGGTSSGWLVLGDQGGAVVLTQSDGSTSRLVGHSGEIRSVASSPDGAYLATASADGTARVWDARTGTTLRVMNDGAPLTSIQFSPDSGLAVTADQQGVVRIWDTGVGEAMTPLQSSTPGQTYTLGFAQGGNVVYGVRADVASGTLNSATAVLWDRRTGHELTTVKLPADAGVAAVPCPDDLKTIEFCDLTPPANLVVNVPLAREPYQAQSLGLAVSPDGSRIAYAAAQKAVVTGANGQPVSVLPLPAPVTGLGFAATSNRLVVMTNQAVYISDPASPGQPKSFAQTAAPIDAELSSDGNHLVTATVDGSVTEWNTASGAQEAMFHPTDYGRPSDLNPDIKPVPLRVAINADGSVLAAGTTMQAVFIWNARQHRTIATTLVASPSDRQVGGFGGNGPWPVAELQLAAGDSRLLAVNFPQIGAGGFEPPGTATVLDVGSGRILSTFRSPGSLGASINPGAALSHDGSYLFGGVLGLAPHPPGGAPAVFQVLSGQTMVNLQSVSPAAPASVFSTPLPAQPWAPDGIGLLTGGPAVYGCASCGTLRQLQAAAERRLAWHAPLSAANDKPPPGDPYA